MANRNICDVDTLSTMSENTNVIVEENGLLNKLNLQNEIDNKINTHFGSTDISAIGDGTPSGAISELNTNLGVYKGISSSVISVASGTDTVLATLSVEAGVYIVTAYCYFNDASSTVAGGRTISIYMNGSANCSVIVKPYEWGTMPQCVTFLEFEETGEISLVVKQTSGNNLDINGTLRYLRIK